MLNHLDPMPFLKEKLNKDPKCFSFEEMIFNIFEVIIEEYIICFRFINKGFYCLMLSNVK
jgi:hypothetical protein